MNAASKYLVVIAGPTGVGKTALAVKLAKHFGTKILSADSRQFYKEISIGTAKPSQEELEEVQHYFIDSLSIHDNYSIGDFEKDAMEVLTELFKEHRIVFLVGGSGLYINALLYGVDEFENVPEEIRAQVRRSYEEKGLLWLQQELQKLDPVYFETVDASNPQRLMRALEVCIQSGKPYSEFLSKTKKERSFEAIKILINLPREQLYEQINKRVDKMISAGLIEEAKESFSHRNLNALNTVGYKELFEHFEGKLTLENAIDLIKQKTRNYAKRQLTWFRNQDSYEEFSPDDFEKIKAYIEIILQH